MCCSALQCIALRCSVLQCIAMHCSVLRRVAVCCGVLRCTAMHCSALKFVAARDSALQFVAEYGGALQYSEACYSALQCVAVRCSALQCVAVRCSALHNVAVLDTTQPVELIKVTERPPPPFPEHTKIHPLPLFRNLCLESWYCRSVQTHTNSQKSDLDQFSKSNESRADFCEKTTTHCNTMQYRRPHDQS